MTAVACGVSGILASKGDVHTMWRFRCKTWNCATCAEKNRKRLIAICKAGNPTMLLTLTTNPAMYFDYDAAACDLVDAWRRMRQQLKRHHGHRSIEFIAVFERTKAGWPHLHILIRGRFIPHAWIKNYMARRTNAPIVDIRKVHNATQAAIYIAKYIAKAPEKFEGCKRYWASHNYAPKRIKKAPPEGVSYRIVYNARKFLLGNAPDQVAGFDETDATAQFSTPEWRRRSMSAA